QPVFAALPPPGPIVGHVRLHISVELLSHGKDVSQVEACLAVRYANRIGAISKSQSRTFSINRARELHRAVTEI
ncbi:24625_t:CDS:2, partial [Gigaspora rosea]